MKGVFIFFSVLFLGFSLHGQSTDTIAIKIYLEDAETSKNVCDAKVTLEGFEIPAIVGKYDKKGKFYYFTEIPVGYNTVMAYHKKYNEKGFQDVKGLPKELKLKLYESHFVSYNFENPVLESIRKDYLIKTAHIENLQKIIEKGKKVSNKHYRYLYNEDSHHITIISKLNEIDFFENDTIKKLIESLSLVPTVSISGNDEENFMINYYGFVNGDLYGLRASKKISNYNFFNDFYFGNIDRVYFFHKKDKSKFKRFNCKEIYELRKHNLIVGVLTNRAIEYFGNSKYKNKSFEEFYKQYIHNRISLLDIEYHDFGDRGKSEQFFFKTFKKDNEMYFGGEKSRKFESMPSSDDDLIKDLFFLVPRQNDNPSIGLGALDCGNERKVNFEENYYFFNSIRNVHLDSIK